MKPIVVKIAAIAAAASLLAACATSPRYSQYRDSERGYEDTRSYANHCRTCGTVERIDEVWLRDRGVGGGTVLGVIIGGLVGSHVGSGHGRQAATVAGAVAGGMIGNHADASRRGDTHAYRFEVQLDDGRWAEVTQRDTAGLRVGDRVIVRNNQLNRL